GQCDQSEKKKSAQKFKKSNKPFEPILIKSFSRFFGSFELIFDPICEGYILLSILPSQIGSKISQNNPKTRRKILLGWVLNTG
ncbi:MAG: hypothetical protein KDK76_04310, partial [Chlamydiia bacterium]|nr:hypothetical protein [Chlamydiia bacterium]